MGGLRLHELPVGISDIWAALLLVAGPTEPSDLQSILRPLFDFFKRHDPGVPHGWSSLRQQAGGLGVC